MTSKSVIALVLGLMTAAQLVGCSSQKHSFFNTSGDAIVGGTKVEQGEAVATMTAVLLDVKQGGICTVSILSDEWMLTAAHCVEGASPQDIAIIFHSDLNTPADTPEDVQAIRGLARRVVGLYPHPKYEETMELLENMEQEVRKTRDTGLTLDEIETVKEWGDLALVKIVGGIPATHRAAEFVEDSGVLTAGQEILLAGYGNTGGVMPAGSGTLRQVSVQISNPLHASGEVLIDQRAGKGACHGDSGGPAYATVGGKLKLFGVTSRGYNDVTNSCTVFSVYTNAVAYRTWIRAITGL